MSSDREPESEPDYLDDPPCPKCNSPMCFGGMFDDYTCNHCGYGQDESDPETEEGNSADANSGGEESLSARNGDGGAADFWRSYRP